MQLSNQPHHHNLRDPEYSAQIHSRYHSVKTLNRGSSIAAALTETTAALKDTW